MLFNVLNKLNFDGTLEIIDYKNNTHKYGRSVNSMELVRAVTNEELSPNYFINHLKSKLDNFC